MPCHWDWARALVWLTASQQSGSFGSEQAQKLKSALGVGAHNALFGLIGLLFLIQSVQDVRTHGVGGLFGFAEGVGLVLLALVLFNRRVPGTAFYLRWRKISSGFALVLCSVCVLAACGALLMLLFFVARDGISALSLQFFHPPDPSHPEAGGMLHAIVGTGSQARLHWAS